MKNEKGSITLLFLLTIAFTAYTSAMIKLQAQNEDLDRIKASYQQDLTQEGLTILYEEATMNKPYTVTFDANGGNVGLASKEVKYGRDYGNLPMPTREGYKFLGWNGKNLLNLENVSDIMHTTINYNKVIFDSYSENGNISTDIQLQKWNGSTYLGYINYNNSTSGKNSFSFTKDSSFNILRFKLNGTKNDASFKFQPMLEDGKTYNFSYNIESANYQLCKATINNIQLEEGDTATEYEPYYVTSDTKVTQKNDHTLKAIWEEIKP